MFKHKRSADDFAEEIKAHLELEADELTREGLSDEEAHRKARIEFGNLPAAQERFYLRSRTVWLDNLLRDVRYGLRGLWRNPGFTTVAVLTLALAIGANSSIFSLLDQALLRALPVHDPGELVVLSFAGETPGHVHANGGNTRGHLHEFTYPMYRDLRDRNTVFSGLIAAAAKPVGITWNNRAETVQAEMVTGNYFETLGVQPWLGRLLVADDETAEGANPVAVLSFDYWKTHLGEAQVVGQTVLINGAPFTIIGVAAVGFHSMVSGRVPDVYVPITMQRIIEPEWTYLPDRQSYWIDLIGRLRPGLTPAQAEAALNPLFISLRTSELTLLQDQSRKARKDYVMASHLNLDAGAKGFSPLRGDVQTPFTIIVGMVLLVVGMAIVNVASLLLVRAATRVREFSVRYALGATGGEILRQLLAEGLLLGTAGAAIGLLLAPRALHLLIRWMSGRSGNEPPFSPTLDWRVLYRCGDFRCQPAFQPCTGDAVLEPAPQRRSEAADGDRHRGLSQVPPHLRCVANRFQLVAHYWSGTVCPHDSESAQRRRGL
jgi:putative ABC transport system permease protein